MPPLHYYDAEVGDPPPEDLKAAIEALIGHPLGWESIGGEIRTFVISHSATIARMGMTFAAIKSYT